MPIKPQARRCSAHRSGNRGPCNAWAMKGATVCRTHGGSAPQVIAAAAERRLDVQVKQALAQLDVDSVTDPLTALSKLAGQVVAWKDALAAKVNELTSIRYSATGAGTEQLRAEVALFERAMDRCAAVLGLMARLKIDERMVAIGEQQAQMIIRGMERAIAAAGVTNPTQVQAARTAMAQELRVIK